MRYSVYDYTRRQYDYYEGPGAGGTHAGSPPVVRSIGGVGASPDQAAWRLPVGSRRVGSGEFPQGKIASLGLGGVDLSQSGPLLLYGAIAYLAWRFLR